MIRIKKSRALMLLVVLCMTLVFAVGCSPVAIPNVGGNDPNGGDQTVPGQLASVAASSVQFNESTMVVTWQAVSHADSYQLSITTSASSKAVTQTVTKPTVSLRQVSGLSLPDSGNIKITFVAKGKGYKDSSPITTTLNYGGAKLTGPEITSFDKNVIKWDGVTGAVYTVKVNGQTVTESATDSYDVSSLTDSARIDIFASLNGETSDVTSMMYDYYAGKLRALPISEYTVDGEVLRWSAVKGATGYKIVDLDFNSYTVKNLYYDMAMRNIVYGVYPVMPASSVLASADIVSAADIKYLEGSGTATDPYLINTPFDLRTVDYYELRYSENGGNKNYYKINANMDYRTVSALDGESNMFTLRKPFFGTLDGGNHTLSYITVKNNNGFWAMFEHIAVGATVTSIKFDTATITNSVLDTTHPINATIAMVAYRNYGTVSQITLANGKFNTKGGEIAGLVAHNFGTVSNCTVTGCELRENTTSDLGTAAYEMAGVVLENCGGGRVENNSVSTLTIYGMGSNIGSSAGVVAINRKGGAVTNNSFDGVIIRNLKSGKEAGGVVGYCATGGTVTKGSGTLGSLTVNNANVTNENGSSGKGKLYGKLG